MGQVARHGSHDVEGVIEKHFNGGFSRQMKRVRALLLFLLLPAQAASLWALPQCRTVMVCHMAQDGSSSCCSDSSCSMSGEQSDASTGSLIVIPAVVVPFDTGLVTLSSTGRSDPAEPRPIGASRDILDPPPRA